MTLPDITTLTPDQLRALLSQASSRLEQLARDEADTETQLRNDIADTLTDLDALIGDGDPKGTGSIVAVRQYTGEECSRRTCCVATGIPRTRDLGPRHPRHRPRRRHHRLSPTPAHKPAPQS